MASATLTNLLVAVRDHCQDNDSNTSNYVYADAVYTRVLNRYLTQWLHVSGQLQPSDIAAATTGLTLTAGGWTALTTITTIVEVIGVWNGSTADTDASTPLERCSTQEVSQWLSERAATGSPDRYSARRVGDAGSAAGKWRFTFHPAADGNYSFALRARLEPTALSSGGDIAPLPADEAYGVAALTGAWGALRDGREELVDRILADVPPTMQALAAQIQAQTRTARRIEAA